MYLCGPHKTTTVGHWCVLCGFRRCPPPNNCRAISVAARPKSSTCLSNVKPLRSAAANNCLRSSCVMLGIIKPSSVTYSRVSGAGTVICRNAVGIVAITFSSCLQNTQSKHISHKNHLFFNIPIFLLVFRSVRLSHNIRFL